MNIFAWLRTRTDTAARTKLEAPEPRYLLEQLEDRLQLAGDVAALLTGASDLSGGDPSPQHEIAASFGG